MKDRLSKGDEYALQRLFQNNGKAMFFLGAALFPNGGSVVALGSVSDEKIAELLVSLEFYMAKEYPAVEELSKNAAVLGQITKPWCTIIGCTADPVKTIEIDGKMMSFCRKHIDGLVTALGQKGASKDLSSLEPRTVR